MTEPNRKSRLLDQSGAPVSPPPRLSDRLSLGSGHLRRTVAGGAAMVAAVALLLGNLGSIQEFFKPKDPFAKAKAALALQAEKQPPYNGNSTDGIFRPQMEAYIRGFAFPPDSKGASEAEALLLMIKKRENATMPQEFFMGDSTFQAALETFRTNVRTYAVTGSWPGE